MLLQNSEMHFELQMNECHDRNIRKSGRTNVKLGGLLSSQESVDTEQACSIVAAESVGKDCCSDDDNVVSTFSKSNRLYTTTNAHAWSTPLGDNSLTS